MAGLTEDESFKIKPRKNQWMPLKWHFQAVYSKS